MLQPYRFSWMLLLALAAGCCDCVDPPEELTRPVLGTVDVDLPLKAQARQEVLKSVLDMLAGAVPWEKIALFSPNAVFEESRPEFFEKRAIRLGGWEFDGSPDGDEVPVVLYLDLDHTGRNQMKVHRVYTVTPSGDRFLIRRKAGG